MSEDRDWSLTATGNWATVGHGDLRVRDPLRHGSRLTLSDLLERKDLVEEDGRVLLVPLATAHHPLQEDDRVLAEGLLVSVGGTAAGCSPEPARKVGR